MLLPTAAALPTDCVGIPRLEGMEPLSWRSCSLTDVIMTTLKPALQLAFFSVASALITCLQTIGLVSVRLLPLLLWLVMTLL